MEYDLPDTVEVASKVGDRLILVRSTMGTEAFVTIDFEWRRWQLGNHPLRMLNHAGNTFTGRNWQGRLVQAATSALLLGAPSEEPSAGGLVEEATAIVTNQEKETSDHEALATFVVTAEAPMEPTTLFLGDQEQSFPAGMNAYAWKRLQDGQLSQDVTASTPEALFVLAGFRPHRVLEPIQGFLCVPVLRQEGRWVEVKGVEVKGIDILEVKTRDWVAAQNKFR